MKFLSLDLGGSTIDAVSWRDGKVVALKSFERYPAFRRGTVEEFFVQHPSLLKKTGKIFVTGGKSRFTPSFYAGVPIRKVPEIEAIGRGGYFLLQGSRKVKFPPGRHSVLVVSMGTGTCMVEITLKHGRYVRSRHIGGTGVGGGTFMGLCKMLLNQTNPARLRKMFQKGDEKKVDLLVSDIVGSGIGVVPGDATASNLARTAREIHFSKSDLAAGIVNLIGQTIGIAAVFAARAQKCDLVILTGKLTAVDQVVEKVKETGDMYGVPMIVPRNAGFVSALGAGYES